MKIEFPKLSLIRRIKTDILFQNLATIVLSVSLIVGYTYYLNSQSVIGQAKKYIHSSAKKLIEQISSILVATENIVSAQTPILTDIDLAKISKNKSLFRSMIYALDAHDYITTIYVGLENGLFIEYSALHYATPYLNEINISTPERAIGVSKTILNGKDIDNLEVPENWQYLVEPSEITPAISNQRTTYDHRKRGWYRASIKSENPIWSEIYEFATTLKGQFGITVSKAIVDSERRAIGVLAADISLQSFSDYLRKQNISPNSRIYVIDKEHRIVASSHDVARTGKQEVNEMLSINDSAEVPLQRAVIALKDTSARDSIAFYAANNKDYMAIQLEFPKNTPNILSIVLVSPLDDFVSDIKAVKNANLVFALLITIVAAIAAYLLARSISNPIVHLSREARQIKELEFDNTPPITSKIKEIQDLSDAIAALKTSIKSFSYYIPKSLVKRMLQRKQAITKGGNFREITMMFTDIANFTTEAEKLEANALANHLSDYFDVLGGVINDNDGTIDKYLGDSVMAFWGAPISDKDHMHKACVSALQIQKRLAEIGKIWRRDEKPEFHTRIGIHTGEAIVGNIGSKERMNYTAIGDSVNASSRLEGLNKFYGTKIIISQNVADLLGNGFYLRTLDRVIVKGKTQAIKIFELCGMKTEDMSLVPEDHILEFNKRFEEAYHLYATRQFNEALVAFEEIDKTLRPDDKSVREYMFRCQEFIKNAPPKEWDGRFTHETK